MAHPLEVISGRAGKPIPALTATFTDSGNAERLIDLHGEDLRYCPLWRGWLAFDGCRWTQEGANGRALMAAKDVARNLYLQAAAVDEDRERKRIATWARKSESAQRRRAAVDMAAAEDSIWINPAALDCRPWFLTCPNGTIDLRAGSIRDHRREDYITKLCPTKYRYAAIAAGWEEFLDRIFAGNLELICYVQQVLGYACTGSVREQSLFFLHGSGANGKSTLLNAVRDALGPDYSMEAAPDLLMVKRDSHPTERAALFGKRLVSTVEVRDGRRLAEVLVKQLTGGEPITARRMREDFWSFPPTHKILLAANHKPEIRGTDLAIWRRIKLIPFAVTIPPEDQDRELADKLRAEREGILAWLVRGAVDWYESGRLQDPPEVQEATAAYRAEQDILGEWLAECCTTGPNLWAPAGELLESFHRWYGKQILTPQAFGQRLGERGFSRRKAARGRRVWDGLGLLEDQK